MKQEEFNQVKEWVEKNTGLEFFDGQARYDDDCCCFEKAIDRNKRVVLCIDNDRSAEVWLHTDDDSHYSAVEICTSDSRNNHQCLRVFAHIVHYN